MHRESGKVRSDRRLESMLGAGIAIGAGFGVALGLILDNLALGIAIGVAIGTAIGASLSERNRTCARTEAAPRGASLPSLVGLALILFLVVAGIVLLLIFGAG